MSRDTYGIVPRTASPRSGQRPQSRGGRRHPRRLRPVLIALEDRRLLSNTLTVSSTADSAPASSPAPNTLRWAVQQADAATSPSTIQFDLVGSPATITLLQGVLELSNTNEPVTLMGPGQGLLSISGGGNSGVFHVDAGVTATLSGLTITDGQVGSSAAGGGLFNYGDTTLTGCTISGNSAAAHGGGVDNDGGGQLSVTDCTITDNTSGDFGGGVENNGTAELNVTDSTISDNSATGDGGGISCGSTASMNLIGCTISDNSAGSDGGGLNNTGDGGLGNCTISGNSAASLGGGVDSAGSGLLNISGCTISGNTALVSGGGGLNVVSSSVLNLLDTIVAGNVDSSGAADDISGTVTGSFNLIGTGGAGGLTNGTDNNIVLTGSQTAGLSPLGSFGGPTQTMALLPNSRAIGQGTAFVVPGTTALNTSDQRGLELSSPVDIGAFQTRYGLVVNTTADGADSPSGDMNLRQAINLANVLTGDHTITFNSTDFGTEQTTTLTQGVLELENTTGAETITGPAAGLIVSGGGTSGVFQVDHGVTAALSGLTITDGLNTEGGGVLNGGTTTLADCTITGNSADTFGGGVENNGTGTLSLDDCIIRQNSSSGGDGGGVSVGASATLTVTDCTISQNSAEFGGGLDTEGAVQVAGSTISDNTSSDDGGGLDNAGADSLAVSDSAIVGNSAGRFGGGVEENGGTGSALTVTDCTISGNTAAKSGGGLSNVVPVTVTACTISGNTAGDEGGGLYDPGSASLTDSIVAGNDAAGAASDIQGTGTVAGSFNLIGSGGAGGLTAGNDNNLVLTGSETAGLAPLGNYGGPTQSIALLPGSPALGQGTAVSGITKDQRGVALPASDPDIGAFQSQGFTLTMVSGTPQSTMITTPFANPLSVQVTANDPTEPVAGGVISFALPPDGPSAALSTDAASIGATGEASVNATAGSGVGSYTVVASIQGTGAAVDFQLTNLQAPPTLAVTASSGLAVFGQPVILTATVAAPAGVTPTGDITFSDGGTVLGSAALSGSGTATLTVSSLAVGTDPITASYGGDTLLTDATTAQPAAVSVAQAVSQAVLVPQAVLKGKHNVVSLTLKAEIEPVAPGAGVPTGAVVFELLRRRKKPKVLGSESLAGGTAALLVKPARVLRKSIAILYSGDADFRASTSTMPITTGSLIPSVRAMVRLSGPAGADATHRAGRVAPPAS